MHAPQLVPMPLTGPRVHLAPLDMRQAVKFFDIGGEEEIWRYLSGSPFRCLADAEAWLRKALNAMEQGSEVGFAVFDRASGSLAGTTRLLDMRAAHKAVEIGSTWYGARFRRTYVNTETKYLLLRHLFDAWNANRVQFLTDARNLRSRQALHRIGALREGVLREHKIYPDGFVRDSVVYSVVRSDWTWVKPQLEQLLQVDSPDSRAPETASASQNPQPSP